MDWVIVVAVVVVIALAAVAFLWWRSEALKRRFGPEYDRVVDETGDRRAAEAALRDRVKRRDDLEVRELSPDVRARFTARWHEVQSGFVDDPRWAVAEADRLVQAVMLERGYPADGFDERFEMVSVDRPELAEQYREAHALQQRGGARSASIDELRDAFRLHRSLFDDLTDNEGRDVRDADLTDDDRRDVRDVDLTDDDRRDVRDVDLTDDEGRDDWDVDRDRDDHLPDDDGEEADRREVGRDARALDDRGRPMRRR
jgi:hypothetical protein